MTLPITLSGNATDSCHAYVFNDWKEFKKIDHQQDEFVQIAQKHSSKLLAR